MATKRKEVQIAHWAVSNATRSGKLAKAITRLCIDCGEQAHCYDHYLGYAEEHRLDVEPVCYHCHAKRTWNRGEMVATEDWREQIRKRMLGNRHGVGHTRSPEHIEKIRQAHLEKPGWALGKKFSDEHRARISRARIGMVLSPETCAKISMAKKGKKHSQESRANMGRSHLGSKRTAETKCKMSEARKRWWRLRSS